MSCACSEPCARAAFCVRLADINLMRQLRMSHGSSCIKSRTRRSELGPSPSASLNAGKLQPAAIPSPKRAEPKDPKDTESVTAKPKTNAKSEPVRNEPNRRNAHMTPAQLARRARHSSPKVKPNPKRHQKRPALNHPDPTKLWSEPNPNSNFLTGSP